MSPTCIRGVGQAVRVPGEAWTAPTARFNLWSRFCPNYSYNEPGGATSSRKEKGGHVPLSFVCNLDFGFLVQLVSKLPTRHTPDPHSTRDSSGHDPGISCVYMEHAYMHGKHGACGAHASAHAHPARQDVPPARQQHVRADARTATTMLWQHSRLHHRRRMHGSWRMSKRGPRRPVSVPGGPTSVWLASSGAGS